jgi:hypothetical protein
MMKMILIIKNHYFHILYDKLNNLNFTQEQFVIFLEKNNFVLIKLNSKCYFTLKTIAKIGFYIKFVKLCYFSDYKSQNVVNNGKCVLGGGIKK